MIGRIPTSAPAEVQARTNRRLRPLIGLVALAAVVGGLFVSGVVLSSDPTTWFFGTQTGYVWQGRVRSLSASWTVPRIIAMSPRGVAGTWIGAEAPGTPDPFIQIGINETCTQAGRHGKPIIFYEAFWSDLKLHFHPQWLFSVNAGDLVSASLTLSGHQWALAIVDRSSDKAAHFSTRDEANAAFNWAEWKQEDVAQHDGRPFPYPQLSPIRFRSLRVDSTAPSNGNLLSTWMTIDGRDWKPTPLANDSFGLIPTHISRLGAQYERIAVLDDSATNAFVTQLNAWTVNTSRSQITSTRSRFAAALRENIHAFATKSWPKPAATLVGVLIQKTKALLARTLTTVPRSAGGLAAWRATWMRQAQTIGKAATPVREAVRLPGIGRASASH